MKYKDRALKWDTIIQQKTNKLGRYLNGRSSNVDFSEPSPILRRIDDRELRSRILSISQQEASRVGIGKSTLHYLRKNARDSGPLKVYKPVVSALDRLSVAQSSVGAKSRERAYRWSHRES